MIQLLGLSFWTHLVHLDMILDRCVRLSMHDKHLTSLSCYKSTKCVTLTYYVETEWFSYGPWDTRFRLVANHGSFYRKLVGKYH